MIDCYCTDCRRSFKARAGAQSEKDGHVLLAISGMCPTCGEFIIDWKGAIPIVADLLVIFDPEEE